MELKKKLLILFFISFLSPAKAEMINYKNLGEYLMFHPMQ